MAREDDAHWTAMCFDFGLTMSSVRRHLGWVLHRRFGEAIRIKRWSDVAPGEAFQESTHLAAHGIMDALAHDESAASEIYSDIGGAHSHRVQRLGTREWDAVRRAFERGRYVIVALNPPRGITYEQLHAIMPLLPKDKAVEYLPPLNAAMLEANITTPLRQAAFLAQLAHESVELRAFQEFDSGAAYEGAVRLGNTQPGDGPRFKGRGPIQLTGRSNYRAAGKALGLDLENHPEMAATPTVGFRVAGWFWTTHRLNVPSDAGNFDAVTKGVNGGFTGKASRDAFYLVAKRALGIAPVATPRIEAHR
jgi:predicted chitinase